MSNQTLNPAEQLFEEVETHRKADYPVTPLFLNRWSPRAYSNREVSDEALFTVLEAGRWAPSSSNLQPWRFVIAKTEEQLKAFYAFIRPNNRLWIEQAPVLILLASQRTNANGDPNGAHAFDTGAAWGSIALQARLLGLATRPVGGFDKDQARIALNVPDEYELHAIVALGYQGEAAALHEQFREKEIPNGRRPLSESIIEGQWEAAE
ncbi:nitroreductase family protein [Paenibacillus sp. MBLB4367]|uniref:nitroreductase family protein n=1 Tax=Paenibacillus sp. MBLB4367 TaxID=3384767 RepID=UPI0039083A76